GISGGALIAVLGALTPAEAETIAWLRHGASAAYLLLLDTPTWDHGSDRTPQRVVEQLDESEQILRRGGWHVVRVRAGENIAGVWGRMLYGEPIHGAATSTTPTAQPAAAAAAPAAAGTSGPGAVGGGPA